MDINKEKVQQSGVSAWIVNGYKGTIIAGTGIGKTRVGLLALDTYIKNVGNSSTKCLIVVPTTNLRDSGWAEEIDKWFPDLINHITIECIQTAHKMKETFDVLICDEIHTTLSPEYRNVYTNITYSAILGLTATIPHIEEYQEILNKVSPVVFEITLDAAVELDLVSPYTMYNLPVTFNRKERALYSAYTKMFTNAAMAAPKGEGSSFDFYSKVRNNPSHKYYKLANQFWRGMTMRRWVCYKASSKLDMSVQIIRHYPDKKWIIFCQNIEFAEKLADMLRADGLLSVVYHSKMKNRDREAALEAAKSSFCRVICSVQALNTGYNLPAINAAICTASTSTALVAIQQLGRTLRKEGINKQSLFITLFVQNTQEEKWVDKKSEVLTTKYVSNINALINDYARSGN